MFKNCTVSIILIRLILQNCFLVQLQNKMCFSDSKVNSQGIKSSLEKMIEASENYMAEKQLSNYLTSMIKYMQTIVSIKVGLPIREKQQYSNNGVFGCIPLCASKKYKTNVRKQFQKAYEECNSRQQLQYFRKFVNFMTQKSLPLMFAQPKHSLSKPVSDGLQNDMILQQVSFNVQIKGKVTWNKDYSMTLYPDRTSLVLKSLSKLHETSFNLRNYILRQSKHAKVNSYVLSGIVPISPQHLRFAISEQNKDLNKIKTMLKQVADRAIKQNVFLWKQPIPHIVNARLTEGIVPAEGTKVFDADDSNKKKSNVPVEVRKDGINDPLKQKILDKAKIGFVKKVKQYNQSVADPASKRDKLSSIFPPSQVNQQRMKQFGSEKSSNNNINNNYILDGNTNLVESNAKKQFNFDSIISNANNDQDLFKKKPKQPKSPMSFDQPPVNQLVNVKRASKKVENYANQQSQTRSESGGLSKLMENKVQGNIVQVGVNSNNINLFSPKIIQEQKFGNSKNILKLNTRKQDDQPDSSKSFLNDLQKEIILEQEDQQQFGNASQLSKDTQMSFQTIPEANTNF